MRDDTKVRKSFLPLFFFVLSLIPHPSSLILSSLILLTACAPTQQAYVEAAQGQPRLEAERFIAADEAALPYRSWLPKRPRAIVVALHGMNDYSNAFNGAGEFLRARGIGVYAYDQRGFGQAPEPGIWAGNENLTQDLRRFVRAVQKRHPRLPVFVLGESMGGAVAVAALSKKQDAPGAGEDVKVAGVILSAPALWGGDSMNPIFRGMLWAMAHTVPAHRMTGSDLKIMASDNIPMLIALGKDPLTIKATRTDAVYGLVSLMDAAYEGVPGLDAPVLLLYGGNDQVIPKDPIEIALARFSHPITFAYYPEGYHMLLRDLNSQLVLKDIVSWIGHPEKQLPSGSGREIQPRND